MPIVDHLVTAGPVRAARRTVPARAVTLALAGLGSVLRVALALVNREANDDHLEVVRFMVAEGRVPNRSDVWQGYQPKLYHVTVQAVWELLPSDATDTRVIAAQLVSCAAGVATLFVARRFLLSRSLSLSPVTVVVTFGLLALNPAFIAVNGQATNDSFVVLFASVALVAGHRYLRAGDTVALAIMTGATGLAALSKGQGLLIFGALVALFGLLALRPAATGLTRRTVLLHGAAFVVLVLVPVASFGQYRDTYQRTGSPFTVNIEPNPPPPLTGEPEPPACTSNRSCFRPGTTSITSSFGTFRLLDLLRHPLSTTALDDYPAHRTSLWTRLYAGSQVAHFEQYPPSWENRGLAVQTVARLTYGLALVPMALILAGLARGVAAGWQVLVRGRRRNREAAPEGVAVARAARRPEAAMSGKHSALARRSTAPAGERSPERRSYPPTPFDDVLFAAALAVFLAFLVRFTISYRDFGNMKAIYLLPSVLAAAYLFARGFQWVTGALGERAARAVAGAGAGLMVLYVVDIAILLTQLA